MYALEMTDMRTILALPEDLLKQVMSVAGIKT